MSKYFTEECKQCGEYIEPYGCTNSKCPIRMEYEEGMAEMAADFEHDKRKDEEINK